MTEALAMNLLHLASLEVTLPCYTDILPPERALINLVNRVIADRAQMNIRFQALLSDYSGDGCRSEVLIVAPTFNAGPTP